MLTTGDFDLKSHSLILPSLEALAKIKGEFDLKMDIAVITVECPCKFNFVFEVERSHNTIIPPFKPEYNSASSVESNIVLTAEVWPVDVNKGVSVPALQM